MPPVSPAPEPPPPPAHSPFDMMDALDRHASSNQTNIPSSSPFDMMDAMSRQGSSNQGSISPPSTPDILDAIGRQGTSNQGVIPPVQPGKITIPIPANGNAPIVLDVVDATMREARKPNNQREEEEIQRAIDSCGGGCTREQRIQIGEEIHEQKKGVDGKSLPYDELEELIRRILGK